MNDYSEVSIEDLIAAQEQIAVEISNRKKYLIGNTCGKVRQLVKSVGLDMTEVLAHLNKLYAPKPEKVVRYRHPKNPDLVWTGRGKRPMWILHALSEGAQLEDFAV